MLFGVFLGSAMTLLAVRYYWLVLTRQLDNEGEED